MTTTELIKILSDNEFGYITKRPRDVSFRFRNMLIADPIVEVSCTGDGLFTDIELELKPKTSDDIYFDEYDETDEDFEPPEEHYLRMPVRMGGTAYLLLERFDDTKTILKSKLVRLSWRYDNKPIYSFYIDCPEIDNTLEFTDEDFGKEVFRTKEEAEKSMLQNE